MFALIRIARALATLFIVVTVVFFAGRLSGDPALYLLPDGASASEIEEMRALLGLDDTVFRQYAIFLSNALKGDFGTSFYSSRPVAEIFFERLPNTLALMIPTFLLTLPIAIGLGIVAAVKHGSMTDTGLVLFSLIAQAVPNFSLAIILMVIFAWQLNWLPTSGNSTPAHYVLPILTLGLSSLAAVARLMRASLLDVLRQDYVRFAQALGLSPRTVLFRHALRTALLPVITIIGLQIGALIGGAVVIEAVFAWPGVGRLLVDAVMQRDFQLLQFAVMSVAATIVAANALVDISYAYLDPRTRHGSAS